MTQTPNTGGTPGDAPIRPTPSTGAERVPPMTPPPPNTPAPPVPPTATEPSGPAPTAGRTHTDRAQAVPARGDAPPEDSRTTASPGRTETPTPGDGPLFAADQRERFDARVHQAVAGFVEDPRRAVQEADAAFDEVVAGLTEALAERSRLLRADRDDERSGAETEDLRIALRQYRDLTERLIRL